MRPNLRSNRNKPPSKLAGVNSAPVRPRKPKKQSKRKPTRPKALAKAPTAAEEVVDAAEQLVALQRFGRALNKVTKPAERARSRTPLEQRLAEIPSSPPLLSNLPEVPALCAGALPVWTSPELPPSGRRVPVATSPYVEEKTYEIEWTVRVGKELHWADSCPSRHFDVQDRVEDAIESARKKITQKTQEIVDETSRGGLQAVITAKNVKPYYQSIGSNGQYLDKVDDIVHQLRKEKKQDIRVSITLQLTIRDVGGDADGPGTSTASQPLTQAQKSAKQKAAKRAIEQVDVLAAANEATHNHVAVIALKHKCNLASCKNFKKCCLALGTSGHLPLTNRALTSWNTAINEGKATAEAPPMSVVGSLFAEQAQAKNSPFFQSGKTTTASGVLGGGMLHPGIQQFFGMGPGGLVVPSANVEPPMSSPPRHEGSDDTNLSRYVEWLIQRRPAQQNQLDTALRKLQSDGWGYSRLRKITDSQWDKTGIGAGTIATLKEEMRAWGGPNREDDEIEGLPNAYIFSDEI